MHLSPQSLDKRVELIKAVMGSGALMVDALARSGIDGLVVEAFGRGNVSAELGHSLAKLCRDGLPIAVVSRCPSGRVKPIYGGSGGGGRDLEDAGLIFAGDLKGPKARLLMIAALGDPAAGIAGWGVFDALRHEMSALGKWSHVHSTTMWDSSGHY